MKVLFLDIDGVCNSEKTMNKYPNSFFPIDKYMAFLVGKIQLDTGCEVVLSSSWRHDEESVKEINKRIVPIIDTTPDLPGEDRGEEIQLWLDENPEVEVYAILDDDDDMLEEQEENFFQTDWKVGLTEEIAKRVTEHLSQ